MVAPLERFREPPYPIAIGSGCMGVVSEGFDTQSGRLVAIKRVSLEAGSIADAERIVATLTSEVTVMKRLVHRNIVQYVGARRDATRNQLLIYMELVAGGSLARVISRYGALPEHICRRYTADVLRGLHYLHQSRVAHRDLKCENLLLCSSGAIKLADFGACKAFATGGGPGDVAPSTSTLVGSPLYMAPEVAQCSGGYDPFAADVWTLGISVLQMLTGKPPFSHLAGKAVMQYMLHISKDGVLPDVPAPPVIGNECRAFLDSCLVRDPRKRLRVEVLVEHAWVADLLGDLDDEAETNACQFNPFSPQKK